MKKLLRLIFLAIVAIGAFILVLEALTVYAITGAVAVGIAVFAAVVITWVASNV